MPFSASIARNMLRVCSVNRAAREAALSAVEAIPREIGREVTERSDDDSNRIERQRTTYRDLLEPSTRFSGDARSKRSKLHNKCGVFR
jgi:hypothetical protein